MKKKLIINEAQFRKLDEVSLDGTEDNGGITANFTTTGNVNNDLVYKALQQTPSGTSATITSTSNQTGPDISGSKEALSNADLTGVHSVTTSESTGLAESVVLTKRSIKQLSKLDENYHVYTKKSFSKKIKEDYSAFNKRLSKKRNG